MHADQSRNASPENCLCVLPEVGDFSWVTLPPKTAHFAAETGIWVIWVVSRLDSGVGIRHKSVYPDLHCNPFKSFRGEKIFQKHKAGDWTTDYTDGHG